MVPVTISCRLVLRGLPQSDVIYIASHGNGSRVGVPGLLLYLSRVYHFT